MREERDELVVGNSEEWKRFGTEHSEFLKRLPNLVALSNRVFSRTWTANSQTDSVVFALGLMCWQDFEEIMLLAGNGYGFGSLKILRGMFERMVTISYLQRNPEQTERFVEFHHISDYKLARELFDAAGVTPDLSRETLAEKEKLRDAVKDKFLRRCCATKGCDKKVLAYSWSTMDLVSMARTEPALKKVLAIAYYAPMTETHATVRAIMSRLHAVEDSVKESNRYAKGAQFVEQALSTAHHLTILNIALQFEQFPELKDAGGGDTGLEMCHEDFKAIWDSKPDS